MIRLRLAAVLAVALVAAGCNKSDSTAPAPSASAVAAPAPAPTAPSTDIPTSEDYEQAALDQINPQNMEQELDKLEKDIGK